MLPAYRTGTKEPLTLEERMKVVENLLESDSMKTAIRTFLIDQDSGYEQMLSLPGTAKNRFYQYTNTTCKRLEMLSNYILFGHENRGKRDINYLSRRVMDRKRQKDFYLDFDAEEYKIHEYHQINNDIGVAYADQDEYESLLDQFTDREKKVLNLMEKGYSQELTASMLALTRNQVRTCLDNIRDKTKKGHGGISVEKKDAPSTESKRCTKCGELKSLSEFGADRRKKDKKQSICKKCYNISRKQKILHNLHDKPPKGMEKNTICL